MKSRTVVSIILILAVLFLVFLTTKAIMRPKKFADVYNARKELNTNRLTAIAELQKLYKKEHGEYAANIEQLEDFYANGTFVVTSTKRTADTIPEGLSMEEAEKQGYYKTIETKFSIKEKMTEVLAELNKKRDAKDYVLIQDFQYIPYGNGEKYKIETCSTDSAVIKFAVYVPVEMMLNDLSQSTIPAEKNVIRRGLAKLFYNGLENDMRERRNCVGIQLGDTVQPSIEIKDYGKIEE